MAWRRLSVPGWRPALVYTHRWLGITGCVLFITWFASGIVMMYARMPILANEERLARAEPLDLSRVTVTPADAARLAKASPARLQIGMLRGRPVYRFPGGGPRAASTVVFADRAEIFKGIGRDEAREAARRFAPDYAGRVDDDGYLTEPDQWTLQARGQMPMFRFALQDAAATRLYVSERTGEVVLRTTRRERIWAFLGPVLHWIYFTPLRRNGALWTDVVIWSSILGCVMCISGLVWGLVRYSPRGRYRLRRQASQSPYAGMMKWHHYAGLIFGVVTLTWTFSGLLSMGPWSFLSSPGLGRLQRAAAGKPPDLADVTLDRMQGALAAMSREFAPKELELVPVRGQLYWLAWRAPSVDDVGPWLQAGLLPRAHRPALDYRYVPAREPERGTFTRFDETTLRAVADAMMPGVAIESATWLTEQDPYYYDSRAARSLPVLRIRYADASNTWLYLDPARGVVLANDGVTRTRRWLYQGLHSLDFPGLYARRPLWDVVVIGLSLGGLALGITVLTPAYRRLRRHARAFGGLVARRRRAPVQEKHASAEATE
jgi:hypothetical protein